MAHSLSREETELAIYEHELSNERAHDLTTDEAESSNKNERENNSSKAPKRGKYSHQENKKMLIEELNALKDLCVDHVSYKEIEIKIENCIKIAENF